MKIVQAQVTPITPLNGQAILKRIEEIARTCYRSEDKITADGESAKKIVRTLSQAGHGAMLEHATISMRYVSNIAAYKDLTRHRAGTSYAVESTRFCLAGSTKIRTSNGHNRPTIEELYNNKTYSKNGAWKRMRIRQVNEDTGEICYAKMKDIMFNGIRKVYKIKTKLGYELTCTEDHQIYTPNGYAELKTLSVGDKIFVNGTKVPIDAKYLSRDWLYYQNITLNKTFVQIAKEFGYNVNTLKNWKRKHKLPSKGTGYFNVGRVAWNKGLNETHPMVKKQADALRKYHHSGLKDPVKIKKEDTVNYQVYNKGFCEVCGKEHDIEVHHIDEDRNNNMPENLLSVCESCHAKIHHKSLTVIHADEIVSIEFAGEEKVYDIEMDSKYHNFSANGVIVHNCSYDKGKFGSEIKFLDPIEIPKDSLKYQVWLNSMEQAEKNYMSLASLGAKPDELSLVLPQSTAASFVITSNLREWAHIFGLRAVGHSRPCVKQIMQKTLEMFYREIPIVFDDVYNKMVEEKQKQR